MGARHEVGVRVADARYRTRHRMRRVLWWPLYGGTRYECNCCGARLRAFAANKRLRCPRCDSAPRHRLLLLWLQTHDDVMGNGTKLLHCAPERALMGYFRGRLGDGYVTVDLDSPLADHHMDLTKLGLPDQSFDAVVCSHVLEHIPDDGAALSELRRVTRPGGLVILQHPIMRNWDTYEDADIQTPEERRRQFGQEDHVRVYGERDFGTRAERARFSVETVRAEGAADAETIERYGLREWLLPEMSGSDLYLCRVADS
jgi:SAM-dependent methyltransferase